MTVTVPPAGTRGSRFPKFPGFMARFMSRMQTSWFRRQKGGRADYPRPAASRTGSATSRATRSSAAGPSLGTIPIVT